MPFQRSLGALCLSSIILSTSIWRTMLREGLVDFLLLVFPAIFLLQLIFLLLYIIIWKPNFSTLRHIPTPEQKSLKHRLLKEPNAFHFECWINEVPNNGLIRYFGALNEERILLTSPEAVREVLDTKAYLFEKQYSHKAHLKRLCGESLVNVEGAVHKVQRKAMNPAFWVRNVDQKFFSIFWSKARHLVHTLESELKCKNEGGPHSPKEPGSTIVDDLINRSVFDIMGLAGFSTDFQSLSQPEVVHHPTANWRHVFAPSPATRDRMVLALMLPAWIVDRLPINFNRCMGQSINAIEHQGTKIIEAKQEAREAASAENTILGAAPPNTIPATSPQIKDHDLLDHVMSSEQFSEQDILDQYMMFHSGGTHTSIAAIKSTIWFLAQPENYHIQTRLRDEIRSNIPSTSSCVNIHLSTFERMPYLTAVRQEVLRLHSAFSTTGRTPIQEVEVCGEVLPAGISISISPWAMHRSHAVWGANASVFDPQRWLADEKGGSKSVPSDLGSYIAFGLGPRSCIARKFAEAELNCIIAALFGRFEMTFPQGVDPPRVTHQVTVAFRKPLAVNVKVLDGWS